MFDFRIQLTKLYVDGYLNYIVSNHLSKTKVGNHMAVLEDLVHDVYEHCLRKKDKYEHINYLKFKGWVALTALNKIRNCRRRLYAENQTFLVDMFDCFDKAHGSGGNDGFYRVLLKQLSSQLRPSDLEIVHLLAQGYTMKEISLILNININTCCGIAIRIRGSISKEGILENPFRL